MVWSMLIAEPVGTAAGIVGGELANTVSEEVAKALEIDQSTAELITTATGHFVSAVISKGIVNVAAGDPIGLGINPITSILTSIAHGATKCTIAEMKKA